MHNTSTRLAINGMGRIGRTLFRLLHQRGELHKVIAVNDVMPKANLIYLLKFDSIRGTFPSEIISTSNGFTVAGHEVIYLNQSDMRALPWKKHAIDIAVEATGLFTESSEAVHHIEAGAKRVLLTTFSKDLPTTVLGVSQRNTATKIISPGDCTINCVAPLIYLMDKDFGVESVHVNVIQGYTTRQELLDKPYKGLRRGRAAGQSIIPFEVNIKPVLENIFPTLIGKIESMSTRVPVPCGAIADISMVVKKTTTTEQVNQTVQDGSRGDLKNIVSITFDPIVSADIVNRPYSSMIDGQLTKVTGNHLRLMAWFDNEWGYASRLYDWLNF